MSTLKKSLSIILAILMLVSPVPIAGLTAFAVEADEPVFIAEEILGPIVPEGWYLTGKENLDENGNRIFHIEEIEPAGDIILEMWIDENGNEVQNPDYPLAYDVDEDGEPIVRGENLPSSYDSRDYGLITPVEYQVGGTCWAHASASIIETAYLKQFGKTYDISEYHTVWYGKNGYYSDNTESANDGFTAPDLDADMLNSGGNTSDVNDAMGNFAGGVVESRYSLQTEDNSSRWSESNLITQMKKIFTYDEKYKQDVILESIKSIPYRISEVKQGVYDYGAAEIYYNSEDAYYNYGSYTYGWNIGDKFPVACYNPENVGTNHAVTIVGWDDNFSRENFGTYKPENDGAWLVKNSWSTRWGNDGYFWLSYEDASIYGAAYVATVGAPEEYEDVYLYDGRGYQSYTNSYSGSANIFTARNDIYLSKISYGSTTNSDYTLKIYKGLAENATDPTAGTLVFEQSGNTSSEKYISIEGDVKLNKGDRFSVVLEMPYIYYEGTSAVKTCKAGDSFYYSASSDSWTDASATTYGNPCIRAIAKFQEESDTYKVTFKDGSKYSETATATNGVVDLPEMEGYTYVFTYNGVDFNGTGVTQDMTVNTHCYPTDGTVSETNPCTTEYKCIYCGKEMKEAVTVHDYIITVVPATVKSIGYTVKDCKNCTVNGNTDYTLYEGAYGGEESLGSGFIKKKVWWQYIDGNLCVFPTLTSYTMPDFKSSSETPWAAYLNEITTLTVGDKVKYLGDYMFSDLPALSEVNLPDTITEIGDYCFSGAKAIKTFDCPESLTKIGTYAFNDAVSLKEINYNDAIKTLSGYAYNGCTSLTEVVIPGTVTSVGSYLFYNCSGITKITVEEGVTHIPYLVWNNSVLEEIVLPSTLTSAYFMNYAYLDKYTVSPENNVYCSVDGVVYSKDMTTLHAYPASKADKYYKIPETVDEIDNYVFSFLRSLKYLDMSDCAVTVIKDKTFNQAQSLLYVNLPEGLTSIYYQAFYRTRISNIYVPSTVDTLQDPPFTTNNYSSAYYFVPDFYTDSETAAIKTWADTNGFTCTVTHTAHDFSTAVADMSKEPTCKDEGVTFRTCECGNFEYKSVPATGAHSLVKGETIAPDCDNNGYTVYTCSACGTTVNQDEVTALGHDFAWIIDKDATCGADGVKHEKCTRCDAVRNENTVIPATGKHSYTSKVTAPTCTEGGYTTYTCVTCGKIYTANYKDALNHFYKWIIDKDATCGADGAKHEKCARCEAVRNENTVIPATGEHSYTSEITKPATHLATGVETFTCSGCGDSYTKTIAKLEGHSYNKIVTAPTCTEKGYTTYTCACGDTYKSDEKAALGHSYGWITDKEATCGETGSKYEKCSRCDATRSLGTVIPATGNHSYESEITTESTCTEKGVETYTCTVCGDSYTKPVALKPHTPSEAVEEGRIEPECEVKGSYYKVVYCAECDEELSKVKVEIPALEHMWDNGVINPVSTCKTHGVKTYTCQRNNDHQKSEQVALDSNNHEGGTYLKNQKTESCTVNGYTGDTYCSGCDAMLKSGETITAPGHAWGEWYETKAPTCTVKGEEARSCSACGNTETREVATTGHSYTAAVTAPTCTKEGYTTYTCACGDSYVADRVASLGHTWGEWYETKAPTCTVKGEEARSCSVCGNTETREVATTGHSYTAAVTAPTCTKEGYTTYTCACGDSYVADKVASLGHAWGEWYETKAPTCTVKGEETRSCSVCGNTETREVATTGHSYTAAVTAPTCTKEGYTTYTCACGNGYTSDVVPALGHSYGGWAQTKAPTCTVKGEEARSCSVCGNTETREVAKTDHSYGEWVVTKAPTCAEKGFMVKTCSVCGANAGSEIMTLNHSLVTTIVPATCTQQGYTNHACANCTYSFNDIYTPAKGHFFVGNDGVCEICGENVAKDCSCMCHKTGFMGFIYKIISFFWKLFRMNPVCACGMEHY